MITDFQSTMLPLLQAFENDKAKSNIELRKEIVTHFEITEDEQREKIPSGKQFTYSNRTAWALSYLKMAGLITSPSRGLCKITSEGKDVLSKPPKKISIKFLKQFESFSKSRNLEKDEAIDDENPISEKTPDELMEIGFKNYGNLKNDIQIPKLLIPVKDHLDLREGSIAVTENYEILTKKDFSNKIFLNGLSESFHGMGDAGSLSLTSLRAETILNQLVGSSMDE